MGANRSARQGLKLVPQQSATHELRPATEVTQGCDLPIRALDEGICARVAGSEIGPMPTGSLAGGSMSRVVVTRESEKALAVQGLPVGAGGGI